MKYVITGGAGHISRPLSLGLLKAGHEVTVIGRTAANLRELVEAGAKAAIGNVNDVAFLTSTFTGADAVYTMVPPIWAVEDWKAHIASVGKNYAEAIEKCGVPYVVNLSSVGAHATDGVGPVSGLHRVEQILNALPDVNIKHLRPPYFYNNLLANIGMIQHAGVIGANYALPDGKFPIVSPSDIADVALEELLALNFTGHSIRYLASDEVSTDQIAAAIGSAIGKPELQWILFTDEQSREGMIQAGLHPEIAKNYTEMGHALNAGVMTEDYFKHQPSAKGKVKLADFAKVFGEEYKKAVS